MANKKEKITLDSVSSMRLYLLVIPVIFGALLLSTPNEILRGISFGLALMGVLLVLLRLTVTFNSKSKTIVWRYGLIFPMIPYRTQSFNDVALILKTEKNVSVDTYNAGTDMYNKTSSSLSNIYIGLKKDNKKISIFSSTSGKKVDQYCEGIADILSFKENDKPGHGKRLWHKKKKHS